MKRKLKKVKASKKSPDRNPTIERSFEKKISVREQRQIDFDIEQKEIQAQEVKDKKNLLDLKAKKEKDDSSEKKK